MRARMSPKMTSRPCSSGRTAPRRRIPLEFDALQFDFDIGKIFTCDDAPPCNLPEIEFDLGIPVLGIEGRFQPRFTFDWNLHFGFGVDDDLGFYFVTDFGNPGDMDRTNDEMAITASGVFSNGEGANVEGNLLFLAVNLTDGLDIDGDGRVFTDQKSFDPATEEVTRLFLGAGVDIVDPDGDGRLTFPEMVTGSFKDILQVGITGGAVLRAHAEVDFSTIDPSLASVLPSIATDILIDFVLSASTTGGVVIHPPEVLFKDISLDLGSFISDFAGPILNRIGDFIGPFEFLIGPDGFINACVPLLSDLLGTCTTGKDLIAIYDPDNGPKVVAFLDFVEQLYFLIDLVNDAASESNVMLNFGDLVLFDAPGGTDFAGLLDNPFSLGLPGGTSDLRSLNNLNHVSIPKPAVPTLPPATKTKRFMAGVTNPGSIEFTLLKPETIFNLLLGQPTTLFTVEFPELGFDFYYRQQIPIIGPLVGLFGGGIGGTLDIGFGYDTHGLQQTMATDNPAFLLNGFFINDLDASGFDRPEATLTALVTVGAGLSVGLAKAGVEGGIEATIDFNLADLNADGKVRGDEIAANFVASGSNPLAIFDTSGMMEFFLRAFVEIDVLLTEIELEYEFARLKLFEFDIPFERPSILATQSGDTLTLNIGPSAAGRLQGDISDIGETIHVKSVHDGSAVAVWSDQFHVTESIASINPFVGVKKIVADGGAGNDFIDLSGVTSTAIVADVNGGAGRDVIVGGAGGDLLMGDGGNDVLIGNRGPDVIEGGLGEDRLYGDFPPAVLEFGLAVSLPTSIKTSTLVGAADDDKLNGQAGDDFLEGGDGADRYIGGPGDDKFQASLGSDTFDLDDFGSVETIDGSSGSHVLDFSGKAQNLTFFLQDPGGGVEIHVGFDQQAGTPGTSISDFNNQVIVKDPSVITGIIGSDFVDTFHVCETATAITLNGNKGSDQYNFYTGASDICSGSATIDVTVNDQGNPWDSGDLIRVIGTSDTDTIRVTSTTIDLSDGMEPSQLVTYSAPAADANVLQLKVTGVEGDDSIDVESTAATVPVRIEAGVGNDVITVGGGAAGVNNIAGLAQPGLNVPFGLGPLVLLGGTGHDAVVINDSGDSSGKTGNVTAFREKRQGIADPIEVGVVSGLGMSLMVAGNPKDGRVEFEGFEALKILLGSGGDTFTVGGEFNLDKNSPRRRDAKSRNARRYGIPQESIAGRSKRSEFVGNQGCPRHFHGHDDCFRRRGGRHVQRDRHQ